ncbi:MAG: S-layer homology domain-containing protein [Oscillospiraceae bacterium]
MKTKTIAKIVAAAIAAMMTVSAGAVPAMAAVNSSSTASQSEEQQQKAMKEALTAVKKRVTIPERLTEFKYSTTTKLGTECFEFTWRDKEYKESINISYVNGLIISYSYKDNRKSEEEVKQTFAKLSDEKLIEYAKKSLKKLDPDIVDSVKFTVGRIDLFGNCATIKVDRVQNGVAVDGNGGNIVINKDTGELISMNIEWFWSGTKFTSTASKLSPNQAREKYKSLTNLTPIYRIVSEYNEKTQKMDQKAVLLYLSDFSDEIDAITGKPSTIWDDMAKDGGSRTYDYYYFNSMTTEAVAEDDCDDTAEDDAGAGVVFTEAELKEISADESMLKKDEITALLNKCKYTKIPDYVKLDSAELTKNEETGEYFYNIAYVGGARDYEEPVIDEEEDGSTSSKTVIKQDPYFYMYVNLNAKTGKVLTFRKDVSKNFDDKTPYPVKANAKIAEAAAKYYYGDIFGEYIIDNSSKDEPSFSVDKEGVKHYWETSRMYKFIRYVNGVEVEGDAIRINVDKDGEVTSISKQYTDVKFPSVPKFDKDEAFKQLFKQIKLNLYYDGYYKKDGTVRTYLLYDISNYTLDSKYRVVSWDGTPLPEEREDDTEYTDIKGIAQENAIKTLARYGITLETENGRFDPNGKLTDKDFAAVVYKAIRNYVPYYIECGDYQKEEKAVTLTRKEAAKVFVDVYGGSDYANLKGIYRAPFNDVATTDEYVGYIAIAKALGFASADSKGNYTPNKTLTRAQAMQMVYDYIKRLK